MFIFVAENANLIYEQGAKSQSIDHVQSEGSEVLYFIEMNRKVARSLIVHRRSKINPAAVNSLLVTAV